MKVLYKAPDSDLELRDIPNTLEELQATVGGYIETVTVATDCVVICNEEGRLLGLPYNCTFCNVDFFGPIVICGHAGEEFTDISEEVAGILMRGWVLHNG